MFAEKDDEGGGEERLTHDETIKVAVHPPPAKCT